MPLNDPKSMNPDDTVKAESTIVHVPFWVVALVSAFLLMSAYAIFRTLTYGN